MKILTRPVKLRLGGGPLSARRSMRKRDLTPGWFHWLGFMTHMVVREFDRRAEVEFEETPYAYYLTVRKTEEAK